MVALPCGSRSTSRTRRPAWANPAARFTLVVVLPTPPFWFTTATTLAMSASALAQHEMTLSVELGHLQFDNAALRVVRGRGDALHRGKDAARGDQVTALLDELP